MLLRPATPLTLLLLAAFILLLLSTLSTPIIHSIPLATFRGVDFGVLGYCQSGKCSSIRVGYSTVGIFAGDQNAGDLNLPTSARNSLTSILIVHPIAAFLTLVCLCMSIAAHFRAPAHSPRFLLGLLFLLFPTLLVSLLAFLVDILLFVPHLQWGGWIVLAATIILVSCSVVTCAMRRTLVSRKARKHRIAENAEMSGEAFYTRQATEAFAKADSPPPLPVEESDYKVPSVTNESAPTFASFPHISSREPEEDQIPLNEDPTSNPRYGSPPRRTDDRMSPPLASYGSDPALRRALPDPSRQGSPYGEIPVQSQRPAGPAGPGGSGFGPSYGGPGYGLNYGPGYGPPRGGRGGYPMRGGGGYSRGRPPRGRGPYPYGSGPMRGGGPPPPGGMRPYRGRGPPPGYPPRQGSPQDYHNYGSGPNRVPPAVGYAVDGSQPDNRTRSNPSFRQPSPSSYSGMELAHKDPSPGDKQVYEMASNPGDHPRNGNENEDSIVQGLVDWQHQGESNANLGHQPGNVYGHEEYVPPRVAWQNQQAQPPPLSADHGRPSSPPTSSGSYYEDIEPRFEERSGPTNTGMPSLLLAGTSRASPKFDSFSKPF